VFALRGGGQGWIRGNLMEWGRLVWGLSVSVFKDGLEYSVICIDGLVINVIILGIYRIFKECLGVLLFYCSIWGS
jgi:hypothetical protein